MNSEILIYLSLCFVATILLLAEDNFYFFNSIIEIFTKIIETSYVTSGVSHCFNSLKCGPFFYFFKMPFSAGSIPYCSPRYFVESKSIFMISAECIKNILFFIFTFNLLFVVLIAAGIIFFVMSPILALGWIL
jgi:hypothetical protein